MRATIAVPKVDVDGEDFQLDSFAWWECRLALDFRAFTRVEGTRMFLGGPHDVLEEVPASLYTVEAKEGESQQEFTREVRYHMALAEMEFGRGRVAGFVDLADVKVDPDRGRVNEEANHDRR